VVYDIRILGERNWRNLALIGKNGGSFWRRPGLMKGCQANDDDETKTQLGGGKPWGFHCIKFLSWRTS
jgi:hypothetical protein